MLSVLRVIGTINAAVWFGTAVFFTFAAAPAFFSDEMLRLLPRAYAGAAAQIVLERYLVVHHWCGVIALLHLGAEWLYAGKPVNRLRLSVLLAIFVLGLSGDYWLLPKMKQLHVDKYGARSTPALREQASRAFGLWHGVAQAANLVMMAGLLYYLWAVTHPEDAPRFLSQKRFEKKFEEKFLG